MSKQAQEAGDRSQQIQAGRDVVVRGVSAAEVVEITRAEVSRAVQQLSTAASEVASARAAALGERVIEHFADKPELFGAFADPDFQYALQDAGRATASSGEEHTEGLLVDLLAKRAEEGNGARVRLATSQAIKAADEISGEALTGLTAVWAFGCLSGNDDSVQAQLTWADGLAKMLIELPLPADSGWLSDLDALNLVRLQGDIFSRASFAELLQQRVEKHLVHGIDAKQSEIPLATACDATPKLRELVQSHQLKTGFVVLPGESREELEAMLTEGVADVPELEQLIAENGYGAKDQASVDALTAQMAEKSHLVQAANWWDQLPAAKLTVTGDVIGFVNAKRFIEFEGAATIDELLKLRVSS